jgi:hypothetical protein
MLTHLRKNHKILLENSEKSINKIDNYLLDTLKEVIIILFN